MGDIDVEAVRDNLPAHYIDCDRFEVYDYCTRQGKCDCTATADFESVLAEVSRLRSVVAGVEAAADEYAQLAAPKESYFARRLRSVLSDTTGGTS